MVKQSVVGFDAREMWLDVESQWNQHTNDLWQDKDASWLRLDIQKPLSVDHYVWHSVFSEIVEPRLWTTVVRQSKYTGPEWESVFSEDRKISAPDYYRPRRVWRGLDSLRDYLQQSWGDIWKPCYLVAVVEIMSDEFDTEGEEGEPEPISPAVVDNQWELLGYDVADYYLISGLCGVVLAHEEADQLRAEWKDHLNEYHLFKDVQKALEYVPVADRIKSDHSPFYVYALYGIEKRY